VSIKVIFFKDKRDSCGYQSKQDPLSLQGVTSLPRWSLFSIFFFDKSTHSNSEKYIRPNNTHVKSEKLSLTHFSIFAIS